MTRCALPDDVHLCFTAEAAVFLDLRTNKYLGVDAEHVPALHALISDREAESKDVDALAEKLIAHRLLIRDTHARGRRRPAAVPTARASLGDVDIESTSQSRPSIEAHYVWNLMASYATANMLWRLFPLSYTIRRAQQRKIRLTRVVEDDNLSRARELIDIFERLRPFFYAARSRCLVDTMTLVEFFARYSIPTEWVFGVRTRPFEAHAWAQYGAFVLNDHPARTSTYVPILVV